MKKLLIMAAVAGFALASCTNDEEDLSVKESQKSMISFAGPITKNITRTDYGEMPVKYNTTENFFVFARKYDADKKYPGWGQTKQVFGATGADGKFTASREGEVVYYKGGSANGWFTAYPYFFEKGKKYAFAAYSPAGIYARQYEDVSGDVNATIPAASASKADKVEYASNYKYGSRTTGMKITGYVPGELGKQVDLMYAPVIWDIDRMYNFNKGSNVDNAGQTNSDYNGVNLMFKHALASVHFKVCVDPAYVRSHNAAYKGEFACQSKDFLIESLEIINVRDKADFFEGLADYSESNKVYSAQADSLKWSNYATTKDYMFLEGKNNTLETTDLLPADIQYAGGNESKQISNLKFCGIPFPTDPNATIENTAEDIEVYYGGGNPLAAKGYYGLLIPQLTKNLYIKVKWIHKYRAVDANGKTVKTYRYYTTYIPLTRFTHRWEMGKRYTYTIAFSDEMLYFAPSVTDWENATYYDKSNPVEIDLDQYADPKP